MKEQYIVINDIPLKGSRKEIIIHPPTDIIIPAETICTEENWGGGKDIVVYCTIDNIVYRIIRFPPDMFKEVDGVPPKVKKYTPPPSGGRRTKRKRILRRRTRRRAVKRKNKKTRR